VLLELAYIGSKGTKLGRYRQFNTPAHVETGANLKIEFRSVTSSPRADRRRRGRAAAQASRRRGPPPSTAARRSGRARPSGALRSTRGWLTPWAARRSAACARVRSGVTAAVSILGSIRAPTALVSRRARFWIGCPTLAIDVDFLAPSSEGTVGILITLLSGGDGRRWCR